MFKIYLNKRILFGFLVTLIILIGLGLYSYWNTKKFVSTTQWVIHTHEVLFVSERILTLAENIEVGQRGYSLTGRTEFLEAYNKGKEEIEKQVSHLQQLTSDNASQQQRIGSLQNDVRHLLSFASEVIEVRDRSFEEALKLNASFRGKQILDSIRKGVAQIQGEENRLLKARTLNNHDQIEKFNISFESLLIIIALVLLSLFYAINANIKSRIRTEEELRKASHEINDLYDNVPCGYHSINVDGVFVNINNTLLKWLGFNSKEEVIGKLNFRDVLTKESVNEFNKLFPAYIEKGYLHDIEFTLKRKDDTLLPVISSSLAIYDQQGNFVKSRSSTFDNTERKIAETKIKNLNNELEAFTYSVSHDLRAPLRSIDGYARILHEDYHNKLDAEGVRVIQVIINNAKRMGQLIDDLLDFSRVGRKEIALAYIDMTVLVKSIVKDLLEQEKRDNVEVILNPLISSNVDVDMIRQVWINLVANALKYTSKTEKARIEISSTDQKDGVCYKISDNGVGFDMQYVDKLFGVFQRLHRMQDFAGTGVGLAIVKRIVTRHKGRIWAEGKLNEGATFYFIIPHDEGK
ncbi:CHASE3 domain-containing protein [Chryseosolibacter indicus]|uniref:histidine kinase n=1 Tax=Chryseosolibacter indicus TaxID=2782351 RepID=A0ABS5VZH5_9BACT|nr:CHASE3 domain-containing protein [Chryseosolibacter indicus]MBT1706478.1 CHASE3 domain-containing protein [Chryseosolibacter indicus]